MIKLLIYPDRLHLGDVGHQKDWYFAAYQRCVFCENWR